MKLYCAWSSFLHNWHRRIINKIYYYYFAPVLVTVDCFRNFTHTQIEKKTKINERNS